MVATFQQFVTQLQLEPGVAKNKQKIGILGGTFNAKPPHVDFKAAINPIDRARMVQAAIVGNSRFDIEPLEVQRGGKSYTYNTMLQLKLEHPNYEYYFIIGGDEVAYLKTWYRIDDLLKLVKFVGVNRPGQVKESAYPVIWVDVPDLMISSTDIRQRISRHQSVRYLVPDLVAAYIVENGLYLNDR
jgi:nicotinate-nucleotide adenylyltransferase